MGTLKFPNMWSRSELHCPIDLCGLQLKIFFSGEMISFFSKTPLLPTGNVIFFWQVSLPPRPQQGISGVMAVMMSR